MGNIIQCSGPSDAEINITDHDRTSDADRPCDVDVVDRDDWDKAGNSSPKQVGEILPFPPPMSLELRVTWLEQKLKTWERLAGEISRFGELEDRISALENSKRETETGAKGEPLLPRGAEETCQMVTDEPARELKSLTSEEVLTERVCNVFKKSFQEKKASMSLNNIDIAEMAQEMDGHALQDSCWDAFAFFAEPSIGFGGSLCILFGILLTCFGNGLFLYVLLNTNETFVQAERPAAETLRTWRYTIGHSQKNMLASQSLVSAVCDGTQLLIQASEQAQLAQDIEAYGFGSSTSPGMMLGLFVILLWFLTVVDEIEKAFSFAAGVGRLSKRKLPGSSSNAGQAPKSSSSLRLSYKVQEFIDFSFDDSKKITFHALSYARIASTMLVCFVRVGVAVALFVVGAWWLAKTLNIENLVLNGAALEFVMNLDELVYRAFIPDSIKALVNNADKLPGPQSINFHKRKVMGINPAPVLRLGLAIVAVGGFLAAVLIPQQIEIQTLHEILCGGDLDFVNIDMDYFPQPVHTQVDGDEDGLVARAAEFKISYLERYAKLEGMKPTWLQSQEMQKALDAGALSLYPRKCEDHSDFRNVELRSDKVDFVDFFQAYAGRDDATTCGALKDLCRNTTSFWIRFLCPQTCDCDRYRGPLWVRSGCPQTCEKSEKFLKEENTVECKDAPSAKLQNDSVWKLWWVGKWSDWYADQWVGFKSNKVPDCNILNASNTTAGALPELLCAYGDSAQFSGSLRLFCAETCGCQKGGEGCPSNCATPALPMPE